MSPIFAAPLWAADGGTAWLRYLQTDLSNPSDQRSAIRTSAFFISPDGMKDHDAEWKASIQAFRTNAVLDVQGQKIPYACVFPARLELIEKSTGEKFPHPACPELEKWLESVGTQKLSVIFAGAYTNNPASLFGHTFLRFQRGDKSANDRSQTLLSYSAGFLAATPPDDSQVETIVKGLFGLYLGFFNLRPYYMNAALYNNSESRDLWEYPLNLTPAEVRWSALYMWELMHMAGMPYFFVDQNCSYRLLTFLEAVRTDLRLSPKASYFVLPIDTIRLMDDAGLVERQGVGFEPSIRRRLDARLAKMTSAQRKTYRAARSDMAVLESLKDVAVLDALIDDWTSRNYKAQTNLSPKERALFDRTFTLRSEITEKGFQPQPEALRPSVAPDEGHRSSWVDLQGAGGSQSLLKFEYRLGVHALEMSSKGYDDFAAIDYFGFNLEHDLKTGQLQKGRLRVAEVAALNPFSWDFKTPSWMVGGGLQWVRANGEEQTFAEAAAGLGVSFAVGDRGLLFVLPQVRGQADLNRSRAFVAPGVRAGFRWEQDSQVYFLDSRAEEVDGLVNNEARFRASHLRTINQMIYVEALYQERRTVSQDRSLGFGLRVSY